MCTASWIIAQDGYTLLFNRDEQQSRAHGRPPRIVEDGGVRALAPEDAEAGGTWIGVNELGVTVCLLNRQPGNVASARSPVPRGRTSRGLLVASLLGAGSAAAVRSRVDDRDLSRFQPFTLVAIDPGHAAIVLGWDGSEVTRRLVRQSGLLATRSSFEPGSVRAARSLLFERLGSQPTLESLHDLHRSHLPAAGAHSVCMHRSDAETVSFSRVDVDATCVRMEYTAGAPCSAAAATKHQLPRCEAGVPA